jgi:glycosyltransferase involved in cell wall biosynthesis
MRDASRVSVLMTVYNAGPWLREAVDSLLAQTYVDWELIAIQNGSTDVSADILAGYDDPRIRVIAVRENMGRTPALRHAFDLAHGEYIAVLDADDVSLPGRLAKQVEYLDARPDVVLVGGWAERIDGEGNRIGDYTPPADERELYDRFGWQNPVVHSAAMYRANEARAVGGYPADLPFAQDLGLWLRLAERGRIGMIGEYLARHRTIPSSMTLGKASRPIVAKDTLELLVYARRHLALSPHASRRSREEITIAAFRYALALAGTGRLVDGLAMLGRAALLNPRAVLWNRVYRAALFG